MRKITDGYARQLLKSNFSQMFGEPVTDSDISPDMIRVKKSALHLQRVAKFKRKELNRNLDRSQKATAQQVYRDARQFMEGKSATVHLPPRGR